MKIDAGTLGIWVAVGCTLHPWTAHADAAAAGPAAAEAPQAAASWVTGRLQFMTNNVGRGQSASLGQPAICAELDLDSGRGPIGGISGNSVNWVDELYPGDSVSLNANAWMGYSVNLGPGRTVKLELQRLQYPGRYVPQHPPSAEPNTTEAVLSVAWGPFSMDLDHAVTDSFGTPDSKGSDYLSLSVSPALGEDWLAGLHIGRETKKGRDPATSVANSRFNYTDYKVSLAYQFGSGLSLTLAHTWSNADPAIYIINGYEVGGHHSWMSLEKTF